MNTWVPSVERIAVETSFSGVVRVERGGDILLARAYGLARRAPEVANDVDTRFGIASGTKGFAALTVMSLIEDGVLALDTTARSLLGRDLPLIDDGVTVEQLLSHRSGIGDYLDEESGAHILEYVLPVPARELTTTEDYLRVLDGHAQKYAPGARFSYSNSGYVVLALMAERATGISFYELVAQRVCARAGMRDTEFLRLDALPERAAVGYVAADGAESNETALPVRGSGDGGVFSTVADVEALWRAMFEGRIVATERVAEMVRARSDVPSNNSMRYGLGFWLHPSNATVILEGSDAGVSFRSVHDPDARLTHTVISNTTDGAWPLARYLRDTLTP